MVSLKPGVLYTMQKTIKAHPLETKKQIAGEISTGGFWVILSVLLGFRKLDQSVGFHQFFRVRSGVLGVLWPSCTHPCLTPRAAYVFFRKYVETCVLPKKNTTYK